MGDGKGLGVENGVVGEEDVYIDGAVMIDAVG